MSVRVNLEIGHEASIRTKLTPEGFTHDWEVFVRGCDGADVHSYIEKVVFNLHETFPKPKRVVKEPPYSLKESGYAGFLLPIEIYLRNKDEPKKIKFNYDLNLQPSGPAIIKVQKEKYVFQAPSDEFKNLLLKGGGSIVSSSSSQEQSSAKPNSEEKMQLLNKPKLGGSGTSDVKRHKMKDETMHNSPGLFQNLFGTPIKTSKVSPDPKAQPPKDPSKSGSANKEKEKVASSESARKGRAKDESADPFQNLFGTPIRTAASSHAKEVASKANSSFKENGSEKERSKNKSPLKDKDKEKDRDRDKSKEKGGGGGGESERKKNKEKNRDKNKERDRSKEKSSKRNKSPSSPKRPPSPPPPPPPKHKEESAPKEKEKEKKTGGEEQAKKYKKEKREKEYKEHKAKPPVKEASPLPAKKEKPKEDPPPPPPVKDKPEEKEKEKKEKHKHKKKDKDKREKKEEKEKSHKKADKQPVAAPPPPPPKEPEKSLFSSPRHEPEKKHVKPLSALFSEIENDNSNSSISSKEDHYHPTPTIEKPEPVIIPPPPPPTPPPPPQPQPAPFEPKKAEAPDKVKPKKDKTKKKEKRDEKKRKRKSDVKAGAEPEEGEPGEKLAKEEAALFRAGAGDEEEDHGPNASQSKELDKENQENPEEYMKILRELQHKIMTLQDNSELQKVVQLIAETGRYEVSARTFDFDLCLLERSTVRRLQEFFSISS